MRSWLVQGIAVLFWLMLGGISLAQDVGAVAAVNPGATLKTATGTFHLSKNAHVSIGDVVTTDETGQVELLFADGTKIVVGPASQLVIDDILMQSRGTAQRFAVSAVNGTFRFITGNSPKPAYAITTPTATMGVRGTIFDFVVNKRKGTNVALFEGRLRLCTSGDCATMQGGCALAVSTRNRISAPKTTDERDDLLIDNFRYVVDQQVLTPKFRAPTGGCGDLRARIEVRKVTPPKPVPASTINAKGRDTPSPASAPSTPSRPSAPSAPDPDPPSPPDPPAPPGAD